MTINPQIIDLVLINIQDTLCSPPKAIIENIISFVPIQKAVSTPNGNTYDEATI
jgi:hypothetical protein